MTWLERLAYWLVHRAARRWPADLAEIMADDWRAELDILREQSGAWPMLKFAGSLAGSAAVEEEGEEPVSRLTEAGRAVASAAGVTLLAAGLFNGVHQLGRPGFSGFALLAVACAVMVGAGARAQKHAVRWSVLLGGGLFAFLLAGNQVAVMPFMGWRDIAPATAVWAAGSAVAGWTALRLLAAGRRRLGALTGVTGGLIAVDLGTIAGSVHAASGLGAGLGWAPAWFPLALLPGGTVTFGRYFPDGSTALGSLPAAGQPFHASDILLGNASAMTGPMLLGTAFLTAMVLLPAHRQSPRRIGFRTIDPQIVYGVGAALAGLAGCAALRQLTTGSADGTLQRLVDNSNVFGFGFVAHPPGQVTVALLAGVLATRLGRPRRAA
jgi:hypothetical protein